MYSEYSILYFIVECKRARKESAISAM